ncbi:MAG: hypothetical protein NZ534_12215, partial [Bacteroidia bacterium]|nr:hypothetical protein [Bacteroidia bacterium]
MALWISGGILTLYFLAGLFCYQIAPDDSENANVQMPVFARKPPGFVSATVVAPANNASASTEDERREEARHYPARPGTFKLRGDTVVFLDYDGFEQKVVGGRYVQTTHWLGTDALGRDLLSR